MRHSLHLSGRFGKTRGWRRLAMLLVLLTGLIAVSGAVYLTRPQRLARKAAELLTSLSGAEAVVGSATFDINGTIMLDQVQLRVAGLPGDAGRLFEAQNVMLKHDLLSLIGGKFKPRSLTFIRPQLYVTELPDQGKFNYELLVKTDDQQPRQLPENLPELFIRGGQIHFNEVDHEHFQTLGNIRLDGVLTVQAEGSSKYFFNLQQREASGKTGPALSGQFDLRTLAISGKLERFLLEGPQRNILPRRMRQWWDQLQPEGSFPSVQFGYDPDPKIGFHAVLAIRDVSITLPYLPEPTRMTCPSGQFTVVNDTIEVKDLTGTVEDFRYLINGTIHGFTDDAPFSMSAKIAGVVPEEPHYLPWLPANVQRVFNRFTPTGKFDALVLLERETAAGDLVYEGQVVINDAKLLDAKFPYPLSNVQGEFKFDNAKVQIVKMTGEGPTGATALVRGEIGPPGPDAGVHLTVWGTDVPIDEVLLRALAPERRPIIHQLLDAEAYKELTDEATGLIQSSAQRDGWNKDLEAKRVLLHQLEAASPVDADKIAGCRSEIEALTRKLDRPVFDLGGVVSSKTTLDRPVGHNKPYTSTTQVDLKNVKLLLRNWHYPLTIRSGSITVQKTQVTFETLSVESPSKGRGEVKGGYFPEAEGRKQWSPKISFAGAGFPIDELLMRSLPENQAEWIRRLRLEGMVDVAGRVFRSDEGNIDFSLRANVRDAKARPYDGGYPLEAVEADLMVTRQKVDIERVTGKHGDSTIALKGSVVPGKPAPRVELTLSGRSMKLEDPVLDLVPPDVEGLKRVEKLFAAHQPAGLFDFDFTYALGEANGPKYALELHPKALELTIQRERIAMREVEGSLLIDRDGVTLRDCKGKYGTGHLALRGHITPGDQPKIDIHFDAANREICAKTRAMLPQGVVEAIDGIDLRGGFELSDAHLITGPDDLHGSALIFDGVVKLADANAILGVPITEIDGELKLYATKLGDHPRPKLDMTFTGRRLRASNREIAPASFHAMTDPTGLGIIIEDIVGTCYGGKVVGKGRVDLAGARRYIIELSAQNVDLDSFRYPDKTPPQNPGEKDRTPATMSAQLSLQGLPDDDASRIGRGSFEVKDAHLYRLPLVMTIMHLVNLSMPASSSFDHVAATFMVQGDDIQFEVIRIESPSLDLTGAGRMAYKSQALDLNMVMRNPGGIGLGPVTDVLNAFKDELVLIHVGGTLDKPQARITSLRSLRRGWRALLEKMKGTSNEGNPQREDQEGMEPPAGEDSVEGNGAVGREGPMISPQ